MIYKVRETVLWKIVDGEAVMVDPDKEEYCYLNRVGTKIWEMIAEKQSLEDIFKKLVEEYDAPEADVRRGLNKLIDRLLKKDLIGPVN